MPLTERATRILYDRNHVLWAGVVSFAASLAMVTVSAQTVALKRLVRQKLDDCDRRLHQLGLLDAPVAADPVLATMKRSRCPAHVS